MSNLTPQEAAEKLEITAKWLDDKEDFGCGQDAMLYAASYLRKIASGEYAPVDEDSKDELIQSLVDLAVSIYKEACETGANQEEYFEDGLGDIQLEISDVIDNWMGALMDGKDDSDA